MAAAHRRSSPSSSTCFRFCDGRMTRGRPQHGQHVLPDATDRHDLPRECDLADHGQIAADHAPGQRRHNRGHHRNADRGPVLAAARPTARGHGCQRRDGRPGRCGTAPRWTAPTTAPSAPCLSNGNWISGPRRGPATAPTPVRTAAPAATAASSAAAGTWPWPSAWRRTSFAPFAPSTPRTRMPRPALCTLPSFVRSLLAFRVPSSHSFVGGPGQPVAAGCTGRSRLPFEKARALRVAGLRGPRPKANGTLVREAARRVDVTPSVTPPQELETSRRSGHDASRPTV